MVRLTRQGATRHRRYGVEGDQDGRANDRVRQPVRALRLRRDLHLRQRHRDARHDRGEALKWAALGLVVCLAGCGTASVSYKHDIGVGGLIGEVVDIRWSTEIEVRRDEADLYGATPRGRL